MQKQISIPHLQEGEIKQVDSAAGTYFVRKEGGKLEILLKEDDYQKLLKELEGRGINYS